MSAHQAATRHLKSMDKSLGGAAIKRRRRGGRAGLRNRAEISRQRRAGGGRRRSCQLLHANSQMSKSYKFEKISSAARHLLANAHQAANSKWRLHCLM